MAVVVIWNLWRSESNETPRLLSAFILYSFSHVTPFLPITSSCISYLWSFLCLLPWLFCVSSSPLRFWHLKLSSNDTPCVTDWFYCSCGNVPLLWPRPYYSVIIGVLCGASFKLRTFLFAKEAVSWEHYYVSKQWHSPDLIKILTFWCLPSPQKKVAVWTRWV